MIINLTQHDATPDQIAAGVVDVADTHKPALRNLLTFEEIPSLAEIEGRAGYLAQLACANGLGGDDGDDPHPRYAMIGGAPFLMSALEMALRGYGIEPVYAFSRRETVEEKMPDGSVRKTQVFKHLGFVLSDATLPRAPQRAV